MNENISTNINEIRKNIETSIKKSNQKVSDVTLIGVTKTIDIARIETMINSNVYSLGENKVQELLEKYDTLSSKHEINWNFIGHLQTNKVKYIIDKVDLIQSVESVKLAQEIDKRAKAIGKIQKILVEVNIANEDSKFGIDPKDVTKFIEDLQKFNNIVIKGLMTVAPIAENPRNNEKYFGKMYELFLDIQKEKGHNRDIEILSMGMSSDYEVAIEQGSNMVRVGSDIFGARNS